MSHTCKICKAKEEPDNYMMSVGIRLKLTSLCHSCDFWVNIIKYKHKYFIINNNCYCICETNSPIKGFGGATFHIKQGTKVTTTNNLWTQGEVPERFRDKLPNNAEFLGPLQ